MKEIQIIWWGWQHAQDLINSREIFKWAKINIVERWEIAKPNSDTIFITPISNTKDIIEKLVQEWGSINQELINFSWIMSTTPIQYKNEIENMHFMFGPNAKSKLKVVTSEIKSEIWEIILNNSYKGWIQIIESDIETHDKSVAITQWLTHFLILISWIFDPKNELIDEWKTPISTIDDMVNLNKFSIEQINNFLKTLNHWDDLFQSYLEFVTSKLDEKQRNIFWTPSFWRVFNHCRNNNFILNEENLQIIMNLNRNNFWNHITDIREKNWKKELF